MLRKPSAIRQIIVSPPLPLPLTLPLIALFLLGACAGKQLPDKSANQITTANQVAEISDPLEPFNRYTFEVNRFFDAILLKPVATWYHGIIPQPIQNGVSNFLDNLRTPVYLPNTMLQGEMYDAWVVMVRFSTNSTIGIGGLIDIADRFGYSKKTGYFGQTLGVWGIGSGFYLHLPIIGPSSPRDLIGSSVDVALDPFAYYASRKVLITRSTVNGISLRARNLNLIDHLEKTSVDYYATVRNLYFQSQTNAVRQRRSNANGVDYLPDISDLDDDSS
ncbi:MAG: VacJ family lipoprotein [Parvularculales bacterium]